MSTVVMNAPIVSRLADADMQAAPAALQRAALRARELAARTGTLLVVARDGRLIEAEPAAAIQPELAKAADGSSPTH